MTTVSVALATYNGERFLREQLDSLAGQSHQPAELVVSDDGSTDRTLEIVSDFAATAPFRVVVLPFHERLGYRANFMRCARHCAGEIIAFCDQDDVWHKDKLQHQMEVLSASNVMLSCHAVQLVDDAGQTMERRFDFFDGPYEADMRRLKPFPFALGMTICMKKDCMAFDRAWTTSLDCNDASKPMAHDQWYPFIASLLGSIHFEPKSLADYRQHDANASGMREEPSLRQAVLKRLRGRAYEYKRLEVSARNRAQILGDLIGSERLEAVRSSLDDTTARLDTTLVDAKSLYLGLAQAQRRRYYTARHVPLSLKAKSLSRALFHGDYRFGSKWHFTPLSILRDMTEFAPKL